MLERRAPQRLALARMPAIRYDTLPDARLSLAPLAICRVSARTQALLRPIAPGKVTTSFAPLGRVLFWELFLRACGEAGAIIPSTSRNTIVIRNQTFAMGRGRSAGFN
jgi:hypothetical protein